MKIFNRIVEAYGKFAYLLIAVLAFIWVIGVRNYILFGAVFGLYGVALITTVYVTVFISYYRKKW